MAKVAFLGLGVMGYPMAGHLARAGHAVTGLDVSEQRVAGLNEGISHVDDLSDADLGELAILFGREVSKPQVTVPYIRRLVAAWRYRQVTCTCLDGHKLEVVSLAQRCLP